VVTGASQGIGRELAIAFAGQGDAVVLAARNVEGLEATARAVTAAGGEPLVAPTDVSDPTGVETTSRLVLDQYGRVDVLVNNSGVGGPSGRMWELDPAEWMETFTVNVFGVFLVSRAFLPTMIGQRSGSIINIGSVTGKRPLYGRSSYTATKSALIGLTRTMASEVGPFGVRVNLLSPGFVAGPRLEWLATAQEQARGVNREQVEYELVGSSALGRLTEARDVADAAVFLASDAARAITGVDLNVNAGIIMY
jgi:NAD(P)-dependent dehydrogenase (short-subunit alcohol dehydrogenase family)